MVTAQSRIEQELARGQIGDARAAAHKLLEQAHTTGEHAYPNADYDLAGACFWLGRVLQIAGDSQRALPYLEEAQQRFDAVAKVRPSRGVARMASLCATERGYCLANLGRLEEAAAAYEEQIRRASQEQEDRDLAVAKVQLASVRKDQHRYQDALGTFTEARDLFARLSEPGSVAVIWHQIGMVHRWAGEPERAEDAYRQSLALEVQLGNVRGQAQTLAELGNLYDNLGRLDEAALQHRRSADHFVNLDDARSEGAVRNNLASTLRKLRRWSEARQEIQRAIECKGGLGHGAMLWTSWAILADIETGAGRTDLAAEAKARARECYLAHRRDGGENHNIDGRIASAVTKKILAGDVAGATADLDQLLADPELPEWIRPFRPFVLALRAIATGSRDPSLTEAPELGHTSAAELLLLINTLEAAAAGAA